MIPFFPFPGEMQQKLQEFIDLIDPESALRALVGLVEDGKMGRCIASTKMIVRIVLFPPENSDFDILHLKMDAWKRRYPS